MKSYTDIEQSKILSEIIPLESADMCYKCIGEDPYDVCLRPYSEWREEYKGLLIAKEVDVIPCWSLAALLDVLQIYTIPTAFSTNISVPSLTKNKNGYSITYVGDYRIMESNNNDIESPIEIVADNPVDVCYKLVLKLHELKML